MAIDHGGDIFAIARERGWDWRDVLDFSASINPLGPARGVRAAICSSIDRIVHYPEREPVRLRQALAELWKVQENQILLGNGSTELIFFLARVLGPQPVTLALPVFSEFHRAFPEPRFADLMNVSSWPDSGLLVLTRPANPTGQTFDSACLLQRNQPILVDESFLEFTGRESAAALLESCPQLMILRSLTKFYALPGLRIGAVVAGAEAIEKWRPQREPWQVNVLAEEAALAAVADREHAERSVRFIRTERAWLDAELRGLSGCHPQPSDANFLSVDLEYPASEVAAHMMEHKILVRKTSPSSVRIAVRTRPENQRLLAAWRNFPCA